MKNHYFPVFVRKSDEKFMRLNKSLLKIQDNFRVSSLSSPLSCVCLDISMKFLKFLEE